MSESVAVIGEELHLRLRQAMEQCGDGPEACAQKLRRLDDGCMATAGMVTRWRDAVHKPQSKNRRALELYIQLAGHEVADADQPPAFDESVRHLTAEPLLGARQAALVDAVTAALAKSEVDEHFSVERRWLAQLLGLPVDVGRA